MLAVEKGPVDKKETLGRAWSFAGGLAQVEAAARHHGRFGVALGKVGVPQHVMRGQCGTRAIDDEQGPGRHLQVRRRPEQVTKLAGSEVVEIRVVSQLVRGSQFLDPLPGQCPGGRLNELDFETPLVERLTEALH